MAASATVLSNNILVRAKNEKIPITPMKLQKLLYYVAVKYSKDTGKSPISECFEVWKYGPVVPTVYAEFRPFGASPISKFAQNARGEAQMVDESFNPILKEAVDFVWEKYKHFSGVELSKVTHQRGSGWYSAFQHSADTVSLEEMINDTTL